MKKLIIILLLGELLVQSISAYEMKNSGCCDNYSNENFNKSLIYKFGISKTYSVTITKNDTKYNVAITDYNGNVITSECEASPILQWAFEDMPQELNTLYYLKVDDYDPLYYDLTLSTQDGDIPVVSSTMQITGNKKLIKKIGELKAYLIKFWTSTFEDP